MPKANRPLGMLKSEITFSPNPVEPYQKNLVAYANVVWDAMHFSGVEIKVPMVLSETVDGLEETLKELCGENRDQTKAAMNFDFGMLDRAPKDPWRRCRRR